MKVIVGLGNPGEKYKNNRHNIGHMLIDYIKNEKLKIKKFKFIKADVFMNHSGEFVKKIVNRRKLDVATDLFVAHDDLDIPLGKFKIQRGEGPRLHNGLKSIEETLKTKDFWRIRIGVDNRKPDNWVDGETYVLSDFQNSEQKIVEATFKDTLERLLQKDFIKRG